VGGDFYLYWADSTATINQLVLPSGLGLSQTSAMAMHARSFGFKYISLMLGSQLADLAVQ